MSRAGARSELVGARPPAQPPPAEPSAAPPVALYVHVPFCLSVCPYCDFVVYAGRSARGPQNRLDAYLAAILNEVRLRAEAAEQSFGAPLPALRSVYIGGGTPSLLSAAQVARLLETIGASFGIARLAELTLEANPGPGERGDLAGFRAAGINRLSIGAQSMQPAELRALGRRHAAADVVETVRAARAAGVDNVALDLLYDVPGQSFESWRASLEAVLALEPDHVSAYALTLDDPETEGLVGRPGDQLPPRSGARRWRAKARREQDGDRAAACYELADELLADAGLEWYELSNWARPGRRSAHNLSYWLRQPFEAVGPGAHAFDGGRRRRWNVARLELYLTPLTPSAEERPRLPPGGFELLDADDVTAERAILALRLRSGMPAEALVEKSYAAALSFGLRHALLTATDSGRVQLTRRGRLLSNELFARLLPADESASGC